MTPLGLFGGYQEITKELVVTSVSIGQSGGEAAEYGMEVEGMEGLIELHEHTKLSTTLCRIKVLQ